VAEHTIAWLYWFQGRRARSERRADIHSAFLPLGCILICIRTLDRSIMSESLILFRLHFSKASFDANKPCDDLTQLPVEFEQLCAQCVARVVCKRKAFFEALHSHGDLVERHLATLRFSACRFVVHQHDPRVNPP
jgi:hypothetical protein